jgi:glutamine synthetase
MSVKASRSMLRVIFPDLLGLARGKTVLAPGAAPHVSCSVAALNQHFDRSASTALSPDLRTSFKSAELVFDWEQVRPEWDESASVVVADVFLDGRPLSLAPRAVLRKAIGDWQEAGWSLVLGYEIEGYLFRSRDDGLAIGPPYAPQSFHYATGTTADPDGFFESVLAQAQHAAIELESFSGEYGLGQFELALSPGDPLRVTDDLFLLRQLVREQAARHDLKATFMAKPYTDGPGSGLHINVSMDHKSGATFFDPDRERTLSGFGSSFVAGNLRRHRSMCSFLVPTVNGYKRLRDDNLAGRRATWAWDDRSVAIRVAGSPTRQRLEHRTAEAGANPYISTAAILQAGLLGVRSSNDQALGSEEGLGDSDIEVTPRDLNAALSALDTDAELKQSMGEEFVRHWLVFKREEYAMFDRSVTDWELAMYFPFL